MKQEIKVVKLLRYSVVVGLGVSVWIFSYHNRFSISSYQEPIFQFPAQKTCGGSSAKEDKEEIEKIPQEENFQWVFAQRTFSILWSWNDHNMIIKWRSSMRSFMKKPHYKISIHVNVLLNNLLSVLYVLLFEIPNILPQEILARS